MASPFLLEYLASSLLGSASERKVMGQVFQMAAQLPPNNDSGTNTLPHAPTSMLNRSRRKLQRRFPDSVDIAPVGSQENPISIEGENPGPDPAGSQENPISIEGGPQAHSFENHNRRPSTRGMKDASKHEVRSEHITRVYKCSQCTRKFTRSFSLKEHLRRHNGVRPFKCRAGTNCLKTFVSMKDRNRHESLHSGEKGYACQCGRQFARADGLAAHRRSESGRMCTAANGNPSNSRKHDKTGDGEDDAERSDLSQSTAESTIPIIGITPPQPEIALEPPHVEEHLTKLGVGVDGYLYMMGHKDTNKARDMSCVSEWEEVLGFGEMPASTKHEVSYPVHRNFPVVFDTW